MAITSYKQSHISFKKKRTKNPLFSKHMLSQQIQHFVSLDRIAVKYGMVWQMASAVEYEINWRAIFKFAEQFSPTDVRFSN